MLNSYRSSAYACCSLKRKEQGGAGVAKRGLSPHLLGTALMCLMFRQVAEFLADDAAPSERHLRKIGIHVSAYVAHVRTQLKQTIPKAIVHCLVRSSRVSIQELPGSLGVRSCRPQRMNK